jgi:hypothetical protein
MKLIAIQRSTRSRPSNVEPDLRTPSGKALPY